MHTEASEAQPESQEFDDDIIPGETLQHISIMRLTTRSGSVSALTTKERIKIRRGAFHNLIALCSNDVVHGSWYINNNSLLVFCIPD